MVAPLKRKLGQIISHFLSWTEKIHGQKAPQVVKLSYFSESEIHT